MYYILICIIYYVLICAPRVYIWLKYGELAKNIATNFYDYNGEFKYEQIWGEGLKDFCGEYQSTHSL